MISLIEPTLLMVAEGVERLGVGQRDEKGMRYAGELSGSEYSRSQAEISGSRDGHKEKARWENDVLALQRFYQWER